MENKGGKFGQQDLKSTGLHQPTLKKFRQPKTILILLTFKI
ncbi:hypothetical protein J699_02975 [Acinetobacter sp. 1000160]|nr:hypothetical protein J699_02975 [Acinetobacter sp. 1000160]